MALRIHIISFLFLLFFISKSFSQKKDDFLFGFQLRPLVPNGYLKTSQLQVSSENLTYTAYIRPSLSFGAIIRKPIGPFWNIETGINFVRRNYRLNFNLSDTLHVESDQQMSFIGYEIPIQGLIYVQLGKQWFMNASAGVVIDLFPSEAESFSSEKVDSIYVDFSQTTWRESWFKLAAQSNLGFEYRTKEKGYYYMGASYHLPLGRIAASQVKVNYPNNAETLWLDLPTGYFSVDLKYFIHDKKK
jgi:hypothetical protein